MLKSNIRPNEVIETITLPRIGMTDKTADKKMLTIFTVNIHRQRRPKTIVDCNACQRTFLFFSKNKKKIPDIQKNM
jgi:hypothetical protein